MKFYTANQLASLKLPGLPESANAIRAMAKADGWNKRKRKVRGGGFEYHPQSLPVDAQIVLCAKVIGGAKPALLALSTGRHLQQQRQAVSRAQALARNAIPMQAKGQLDPERNPKLDLIERALAYHEARGGPVWTCVQEFCEVWNTGSIDAYPGTLETYPTLIPKTLDKYLRDWRVNGVDALYTRKPRSDKGKTQLTRDGDLYEAFLAAMAEIHDPTARQVARVLRTQVDPERVPTLNTLRRWMTEFNETYKATLLKFKSPDAWRNRYMAAFGSRSEHITRPNEEWQLDSTIADAQQRVELAFNLTDGQTGEIRRHALVAGIDVFTRRAVVLVSRTSSANAVKAVTRQAMLAWGQPERVKTDNGRDYTAQDYDFALNALGVQHILCTPFSPDQKPFIERFLGTLLHDLFPMLSGFVGHDVATRKAIESGKSFAQRFGDKGVDLHMTPEQLQGAIDQWLAEYHDRTHSELGCSPNAMALRHTTSITRVDERALDILLMPVAGKGLRTVGKRGISLGNAWFQAAELATVMGEEVYCRQDEADLGALHVYAKDGRWICKALDHTLLGINRSELAARTRALHSQTVRPMLDQLNKARKKGLAMQAVAQIRAEQQDSAVAAASNVHRLAPRVVQQHTDAVASVLAAQAAQEPAAQISAREAARAHLEDAAPVLRLDTPKQRYSAWVRVHARAQAGQALTAREQEWMRSYEHSAEFEAWHSLHEGSDPLAHEAGG